MTGFRRGGEHDEDLLVLARQRPLADDERRELGAILDADPTLRVAHDVGRAFDDVAFVRPGDEALIARVADRTLGIGSRRAVARRWRLGGAAAAAGLLLFAGAAAAYRAGIGPLARRAPAVKAPDVARPAPPARSKAGRARDAAEAPALVPLVAPVAPPADAELHPATPPASRPSRASIDARPIARPAARPALASGTPDERPPAPGPAEVSTGAPSADVAAADLFRRAGAARAAGALAEACALYRDLQARFPAAEEARLSHVSLGKLLLAMGLPAEAEHHVAAYLAGGAGALAVEAVFGRAQSFERMRRPREERDVWLGLLRDFPGSIYAGAARRRIAALDASGGGQQNAPGVVPPDVTRSPP
jgi:hypothetical protein